MEPAEADTLLNSMTPNVSQLSPRRRVEVSRTVTPGGTRVTTTTTTTQKPQHGRTEPAYQSEYVVGLCDCFHTATDTAAWLPALAKGQVSHFYGAACLDAATQKLQHYRNCVLMNVME